MFQISVRMWAVASEDVVEEIADTETLQQPLRGSERLVGEHSNVCVLPRRAHGVQAAARVLVGHLRAADVHGAGTFGDEDHVAGHRLRHAAQRAVVAQRHFVVLLQRLDLLGVRAGFLADGLQPLRVLRELPAVAVEPLGMFAEVMVKLPEKVTDLVISVVSRVAAPSWTTIWSPADAASRSCAASPRARACCSWTNPRPA